jgi:hypothetical protein
MVSRFLTRFIPNWNLVLLGAVVTAMPVVAGATELVFALKLSERQVELKPVEGRLAVTVEEAGYELLSDEGRPALPYRVVNILLPQGERVSAFHGISTGSRVMRVGYRPVLAAAQAAEDGTVGSGPALGGEVGGGDVYPPEVVRYVGTGYLHGCGIASFMVFPLQASGEDLVLHSEIRLAVETEGEGDESGVVRRLRYREGFTEERRWQVTSRVVNPEQYEGYEWDEVRVEPPRGGFQPTGVPSLEGSPVDYVIITPSSLAGAYQQLADWKTAKGVPTVVRTVEWIEANYRNGVDVQETIRNFLKDAYAKWGITYALLGGDTPQIPARYGYVRYYGGAKIPTDMYFACLDGSWNADHDNLWGEGFYYVAMDEPDLYADIYVGRLPTRTVAEVNTIYDKIVSYETPRQRDYLDRLMFLAEVLFPVDWVEGQPIDQNGADNAEYLRALILQDEPIEVTRMYQTEYLYPGSVDENRQAAMDSMESGYNHVIHIGHGFNVTMSVGDGSIIVADALALNHPDRYMNLYMLNCNAAAYDYNCLAEAFLSNPHGGAVTCVGANRSAFPNASSYYMDEYYRLLFDEDVVHIGEAFARSRLPRTPVAEASDGVDLWTHYIYTLLGDPELSLWTGPVDTLGVTHVSSVGLGESELSFTVTANGAPVDSAVVCVMKGEEDYRYAATNGTGQVTIPFRSETPGEISVVVTGLNVGRHESAITVTPSAPAYVRLSDVGVVDDGSGSSEGNGDGVIDGGETVELTVELANSGGAATGSVTVVLRSSSSEVVIEDSTAAVGVIGAGMTKAALDPFRVVFSKDAADETAVEFTLVIGNTPSGEWRDEFTRLIHAPKLDLISLRVDDSATGNGNGRPDAGEAFRLYYELKNYGTGTAVGLSAELADLEGGFTFTDSVDGYADLPPVTAEENTDGFLISESTVLTEHHLGITITDGYGRVYRDTLELREPSPPSALAFDVSLGADRLEVSWAASASSDVRRYQVYHSLTSGGPYELRTVDPVDHTVYLDVGLQGSTKYFYVVTAVDSSGNESDYSAEYWSNTNPPQLDGWPIEMAEETTCSPIVGDIDGDGDMEIVAGNDYVYAWHHDGNEMIDGDADPQTWGVLNTQGDLFTAPITLGNINNVKGMDIIAVSYYTKQVFCFDYTGATIAGWPQSIENNSRTAAVVCDLDGNGDPEIVAVDQGGIIYAWNHDGTEYRDGDSNPATQGVFFRTPTPPGWHYQTPACCDIDEDGRDEIILGTLVDTVYVLNDDGTSVPGWPKATNGDVAGSIAVGDIDGDGHLDMVVPTKSSEVNAYRRDGTVLWTRWVAQNTFFAPSPALADFDGDGTLETVYAGSNHKLYIIRSNGTDYPNWPITYNATTYTESSPVVADVDGDGSLDIILGDESKYLSVWDINGQMKVGFPIATGDFVRATPTIADVDLDADVEIVLAGWDKNLYIWDLAGYADPTATNWPTFHANVHRNGLYGDAVATGLKDAVANLEVRDGAVDLTWSLGAFDGDHYDILRAMVNEQEWSGFVVVASQISPDPTGIIRLTDRGVEIGCKYVYKLRKSADNDQSMLSGVVYIPVRRGSLLQNRPNPFNPSTRIVFYVPEGNTQSVSLMIFDVAGSRIRVLVNDRLSAGRYEVEWDGHNDRGVMVGSGVYFYQLRQRGFIDTKKMLLIK